METHKKDDAFMLYTEAGLGYAEIAPLLNITSRTLGNWATAGNWVREMAGEADMQAIIRTALMHECDQVMEQVEVEQRLPTKAEAQMISKLTTMIKRMSGEMEYDQYMAAFKAFNDYMIKVDLEFAAELIKYMRSYMEELGEQRGDA